ncbi:MAG: thiamin pyrophosphokinase [Acidimicrobiia bacterium]|nr:MAG: thiamin pyrophosphokinase [Acidimicrobiia bacterium]
MRTPLRRRRRAPDGEVVRAPARVGRRTKELAKRIGRGEIAVIDHADLDRVAAEMLVAAQVGAVVNASPSISGRYPNGGPIRLVRAGIPLLDDAGPGVLDAVRDGEVLELRDGGLWRNGEKIASGAMLDEVSVLARMEDAKAGIGAELRRFARNTLEYVEREADLTFEPLVLPPLRTSFRNRHALVVVRGHDYKEDLRALRPYIREYRPVLVAVDGGADALLEVGLRPDLIVGDFDSLSERAWRCGAQLVHHVHPDGRAPGREELQARGVEYDEFVAEGVSEDVAMLLAYEAGASLIVAVGTHATMVEFLDKGRQGMASTFLTRLRLGPVLVDAKGVSRLYEGRMRRRDLLALVGAATFAMVAMALASDALRVFLDGLRWVFEDGWRSITDRL